MGTSAAIKHRGVKIERQTWQIDLDIKLRRIFPASAVSEFQLCYLAYRAGYNRLTEEALEKGLCRYPQRPKNHYIEHMCYDTMPFNPRYSHNFLSEDFIRRTKLLAIKSHPAHLSRHVNFKYCLQFCLRMRKD